ncbi:MAG: NUDIX domain-containing protein [Desulfomonilaceae bacterium]
MAGVICPQCGAEVRTYRNPIPTADVIIVHKDGVVLIKRKNPPYGWALPGGFIDYGETAEQAAVREAQEETGLRVSDLKLFGVYSAPDRDPRQHTITIVFSAHTDESPHGGDDAAEARVFSWNRLPEPMAFDHAKILRDFFQTNANDPRLGKALCAP